MLKCFLYESEDSSISGGIIVLDQQWACERRGRSFHRVAHKTSSSRHRALVLHVGSVESRYIAHTEEMLLPRPHFNNYDLVENSNSWHCRYNLC